MNINELTITPKKLLPVNELTKEAGFNYSVYVSEKVINKVTLFGKQDLNVFLKVCAGQLGVSFTDSKNWEKTRLFYPMPRYEGSLSPEEIIIKSKNGDVEIYFAFEDAEIFSTPL
ncbi:MULTISPECIES: hypothetical protein [unclassified Pseudoalteromonas]|uniref:hypothetical protein n=1 Tax=unclassified Pseudoalteromonas TaxID=194690 RepID=UPI0003FD458E|nr:MULTISPECIES: hypothetical protein [unclassified Pseudoalteromonas]MCK8103123.1 hypothetical protein [Pseudoalteromonas sp. 2CM36K]